MVRHPAHCAALLALFFCLVVAGCGSSADDQGAETVADAVGRGNIAETRATEQEAKVAQAREELARLKRERERRTAANAAQSERAEDTSSADASATGADSGNGGAIFSPEAQASFEQLAGSLSGTVGIAASGVGSGQQVEQLGPLQDGVAWSTSKVPVAMAAINAGVANDGDLSAAITASDNAAATNLWNALGGGERAAAAATDELRAGGDASTTVESRTLRSGYTPFGQTDWPLADQVVFTAGMSCTAPGQQVLSLMGQVISAHRWGLGSIGDPVQIKGGWGPGSSPGADGGYLDRQMGIVTIDGKPLAVAIAALPSDGSHESGTSELTTLARWVAEHASTAGLPAQAHC